MFRHALREYTTIRESRKHDTLQFSVGSLYSGWQPESALRDLRLAFCLVDQSARFILLLQTRFLVLKYHFITTYIHN